MKAAHDSPDKRKERSERKPAACQTATLASPVPEARGFAFDGLGNRALLSLLRSGRVQRKARLSQPGDPREHEADRAADAVMSADRPVPGGITGQIEGARPLDEATRSLMESRFGESFAGVRVHTGHHAADAAVALDSRAFTVGEDIVFGNAEFAPETTEGRRLLAHELAHVVQQRQTAGPLAGERAAERDANDAAHQVSSGGTPRIRERAGPRAVQKDKRAVSGTAAHQSAGLPTIVRIDAYWRYKSAIATLSNGKKVPLTLTRNELEPGDTEHALEYGSDSGPEDSPIVELDCAGGASCPFLWRQPSNYALSPKVTVSIKLDPEESARRRIARLPEFIQDYLYNNVGGGNLEYLAKLGEDMVKAGTTKADLAPIEVEGKAPPDPEFAFVQAARKGWYSKFASFGEFRKDYLRNLAAAKEQARATALTPPDPFEGAEWQDDPAAAQAQLDQSIFAEYDKALKAEAAALRHVGEVASMAQNAWLEALGISAVVGGVGAGLAAIGIRLAIPTLLEARTGISYATWLNRFATFGLGTSFGWNLINRSKEGIAAGSNPLAILVTAVEDTFGGKVLEKIRRKSNLTGAELQFSTEERVTGGILDLLDGLMNVLGASEAVKTPGVVEPPIPGQPPPDPIRPVPERPALPAAETTAPPAAAAESPHAAAGDVPPAQESGTPPSGEPQTAVPATVSPAPQPPLRIVQGGKAGAAKTTPAPPAAPPPHQSPWLPGTPANDVAPMPIQSKMAVGQNVAPTDLAPASVSPKFVEPGAGVGAGDTAPTQPTAMSRPTVTSPPRQPAAGSVRTATGRSGTSALEAGSRAEPSSVAQTLRDAGMSDTEIARLAGQKTSRLGTAPAGRVARLGQHFTASDLQALAARLEETGAVLTDDMIDALIEQVSPGEMEEVLNAADLAQNGPQMGIEPDLGETGARVDRPRPPRGKDPKRASNDLFDPDNVPPSARPVPPGHRLAEIQAGRALRESFPEGTWTPQSRFKAPQAEPGTALGETRPDWYNADLAMSVEVKRLDLGELGIGPDGRVLANPSEASVEALARTRGQLATRRQNLPATGPGTRIGVGTEQSILFNVTGQGVTNMFAFGRQLRALLAENLVAYDRVFVQDGRVLMEIR